MKLFLKLLMLSSICVMAFSVTSCGDDEPENPGNNNNVTTDYFDEVQGLWMMVQYTDLSTGQTNNLDGKSYRYCNIYSEDGKTLYGQYISYPSMSKGKTIKIEIEGDNILSEGETIGTILQCGKDGSSKIELAVEWVADQEVFNPYPYKCVGYYWRDTWSSL